jgi:hypothetical protein
MGEDRQLLGGYMLGYICRIPTSNRPTSTVVLWYSVSVTLVNVTCLMLTMVQYIYDMSTSWER